MRAVGRWSRAGGRDADGAHPVDVHVGNRVRLRRLLLGINQPDLAAALGITFQQVQKYERGSTRISASRLKMIADYLEVRISYFFAEMDGTEEALPAEMWQSAETINLVRFYYGMPELVRHQFLKMLQVAAH